jgi:hypothetical protein
VTVLIETFAGKRKYYIYADSDANVTDLLANLSRDCPQEKLSTSVHRDSNWDFIGKFSKDFLKD